MFWFLKNIFNLKKRVTIRKGFQFIIVKVKRWLFFLHNLIFVINLGSFFYNYTLPHATWKIVTLFFLPKVLFSNFERSTLIKTKIWLYFPQSFRGNTNKAAKNKKKRHLGFYVGMVYHIEYGTWYIQNITLILKRFEYCAE